MANPATLTVNQLSANSVISQPSAQTIDTTGTVPIALTNGRSELLMLEVVNGDDAALTVLVKAGDNPPGHRAGVGDLSVALAASGGGATANRVIGPFESSRFLQDDGTINVTFTPATGAPSATVRVYQLPHVV